MQVESNDHVFRFFGAVESNGGLRQLRQADGQVDVGARPVHAPVAAVAGRIVVEHDSTELKRAVEVGWPCNLHRSEIADEYLRFDADRRREARHHQGSNDAPSS